MIQVYQQRPFFNKAKNKWDTPFVPAFDQLVQFATLSELFTNGPAWLGGIPEDARVNLFYTINPQVEPNKREARHIENLAFDVDKIEGGITDEIAHKIFQTICETLKIDPEKTGSVLSGNGVHVLIELDPRDQLEPEKLEALKEHYKDVCRLLEKSLQHKGIKAKLDTSIFEPSRVLRFPGTINLKPDREKNETWENPTRRTVCKIIQGKISPQHFNLAKASAIPNLQPKDALAKLEATRHYEHDEKAILEGCEFIKWAIANPAEVTEPPWYALLSVVGNIRTEDDQLRGRTLAHEISSGHPDYTREETEAKLEQALNASGPRTCKSIDPLWGKCQTCKFNGRVASPISIVGEDFVKSKQTGFRLVTVDSKGNPKPGIPDYDGLMKWFAKKHPFVSHKKRIYTFSGKHWEDCDDGEIRAFAEKHLDHKPSEKERTEFVNKLYANHTLRHYDWFMKSIEKKANFSNGVLDLRTRELLPHSKEFGFKSHMPFDYNPGATAPRFERFLEEVTCGKKDLQMILEEFMGYCISGIPPSVYQKALILQGEGRNGKSVFLNTLRHLAGEGYYSAVPIGELTKAESRVALDGKLFNVVEELSEKDFKDSSFLKNIATGDAVSIRNLYKDVIKATMTAKLIMACNEIPKTMDHTEGFYRRFIIVPFRAKFDIANRDITLASKLLEELPGVFNVALRGLDRLVKQGHFTVSEDSDAMLDDFKEEIDTVRYFVKNYLELTPLSEITESSPRITMAELYARCKEKLANDGHVPITKRRLIKKLHMMWGEDRDDRIGATRDRGFKGVRVKDDSKF